MISEEYPVLRYRWVILGLAWFAFLVMGMSRAMLAPLIPEIKGDLMIGYTETGMLLTGWQLAYGAMQLPSGIISDKIGVRRTHAVAITFIGVFCILAGTAVSSSQFFWFRLLNGIACGFVWSPAMAILLRWFPPKDRAIATGIYITGSSVGTTITTAISPLISAILGSWRWTFWILGVIPPFAAVAIMILEKETPQSKSATVKGDSAIKADSSKETRLPKSEASGRSMILKSGRMWILCVIWVALTFISTGTTNWAPTFLVETFNISTVQAGFIMSLSSFGAIFSPILAGFISDKVLKRRAPVLLIALSSFCIGSYLLSLLGTTSLTLSAVLFVFTIFLGNMSWPLATPILSNWFPLPIIGTAIGLLNSMQIVGSLSSILTGFIRDTTGSFSTVWFTLALVSTPALLAAIYILRVEEKIGDTGLTVRD